MNRKGQFSIIAALFVAVILIATVIVTYSTIRNSPIQDQPQLLSAIDETNFAIKQILGFTVGYYGSVLQVTGNSSYARTLAISYLHSGLVNIANMHPEWGASFNVSKTELHTYWFTNTSYSRGNLAVTYNLTGLGIYGITYETSCRLMVQIENALSTNQTQVVVTKDEGEPIINLGKQNFKFYRYTYENSTWELITPSTEPVAFANGTYMIDIPSGIDPYSYLIQIEDSRGLIVVASSFSRYTCRLTWDFPPQGYRVQQGRALITATQQDIAVSEVSNLSRAFVMFNHYYSSGQRDQSPSSSGNLNPDAALVSAHLLDTAHIRVNRHSSTSDIYIDWQVIECLDGEFEVYRGSCDWDTGNGTSFSTDIGATVVPASCFAWVSGTTTSRNSREAYDTTLFRAYISSPTQIAIQRRVADANTDGTLRWVVVEFDINKIDSIQTGTTTVDGTHRQSSPRQANLDTSVDTSHSILLFQIGVADSGLSQCSVAGRIADSQTIEFYVHSSNEIRDVRWYVIDFGSGCGSKQSGTIDYSGDADWFDHDETLNPSVTLNRTISFTSLTQDGTGTAFVRPFPNAHVENSTNYNIWRSRYGQEAWVEWQVLELPYSKSTLLQDATIVGELLQNGTMRWLGQNLQLTTQAKPIPPIPVKSIHINQTINDVSREVPFQVEDWASNYRIPLGLTNNASVFNSRTMLVFLSTPNVSKVTIWWDGSDTATQTPYAYTNQYFIGDNPGSGVLTNGILTLQFGGGFTLTSTVGSSSCTAKFMRINNEDSVYGASPAYVIHHGIVRDIIHQEAEWSGGANNCPNLYAHIVLTLPANATYYTYQLRLMFVESQQDRTITDLCPIKVTASTGQPRTENGTANGYPIVSNTTGLFYNFSASSWTHHWSQFVSGTTGAGIMFRDSANQKLYFFDALAGNNAGALKVSNSTQRIIELLPVASELAPVNFTYALDVTWHGAVVTFDGTTPICEEGGNKTGLWIIVEYPPIITVTTES